MIPQTGKRVKQKFRKDWKKDTIHGHFSQVAAEFPQVTASRGGYSHISTLLNCLWGIPVTRCLKLAVNSNEKTRGRFPYLRNCLFRIVHFLYHRIITSG